MYKNVNIRVVQQLPERLPDGSVRSLPIDQFIVSDKSMYKADGFPRSDVSLLDRFNKTNVDPDLVNQVAARMQEMQADETMKDYPDDMKLKLLRPAWCQTATELADFSEHVFRVIDENKCILTKDETETLTSVAVEAADTTENNNETSEEVSK